MKAGSKYYPLFEFLQQDGRDEVTLTFTDIEALGVTLPKSARTGRGWWSNRSKGALQSTAWMDAGYHVKQIDLEAQQVTFARRKLIYVVKQADGTVPWDGELIKALRQHMGLTQAQLAQGLGVRQVTISEWETGAYAPRRATSKYLTLVAERAGFVYSEEVEDDKAKG